MTRSRLTALLLASTLLLGACAEDAPVAEATPSLTVSVATPAQQSLPQRVIASGSIAAWEEVTLGVEISGHRIASINVEVGDRVSQGQPLLQLDTRQLAMDLRQAEANLEVASANARRGERLLREKLVAASEAEQLIAGEVTARAQAENARLRLAFATLRAPHDGIISARSAQPGQVVAAGGELLRLIRDGRLEWRAELPERDLIRITPGMAVALRGPDGEAVEGRVRVVSPALDAQSRTGVVYADLPVPGALRAGMYAAGDLVLGDLPARTVPDQAIVERDGYRYVFVLGEGDVVSQRRVELGVREGGLVQVVEGLEGDEQVVVEGAGFLADGDRVRVVAATEG